MSKFTMLKYFEIFKKNITKFYQKVPFYFLLFTLSYFNLRKILVKLGKII